MTKKHIRIALFGLVLGAVAGWTSGCTNHRGYTVDAAEAAAINKQRAAQNAPLATGAPSLAGNWACDDAHCDSDTIKTISNKLNGIRTQATERHSNNGVQGVCRIQEISRISVSSSDGDADTLSGNLNLEPAQVIESPDNTHDCQSYYDSQNQNLKPTTDSITLILNSSLNCPGKLSINGVCYRNLTDQDLKGLNSARAARDTRNASLAGDWTSLDSDKPVLQATISSDQKTLQLDVLMNFKSKNEKCRVQETTSLSLENPDETNPDSLNGSLYNDVLTLVPSEANGEDCQTLVEGVNKQDSSSASITFERDGNQYLIFSGQRFVRKSLNGSEN